MNCDVVFVGLGNMGLPMAKNLVRGGYSVAGHDLDAAAVADLVAAGGTAAVDLKAAVRQAKAVVTMLPTGDHVAALCLGDDGFLAHAQPGTVFIDSSTIAPEKARQLAKAAAERGVAMVDAPVSGGVGGATAGTLTFMVGGSPEAFAAATPLLQKMGKAIYHAGVSGSGQTVKICNNMLLGVQMIGTAEALRLGIANGMDPKVLSEVIAKSSGNNWVLATCNPCPGVMEKAPASNGYAGGFGVDLMRKDLRLAVESAIQTDSAVPLGAMACNLYDLLSKSGAGRLDYGSIFLMLGKAAPH
jgi:3-hydroxyisobutyrate dehydrogenase